MGNNIRDLRRQIRSIRNTAQLTRAMKMVSAAKLRRSQEAMQAARPYSQALRRVLADVARRSKSELNPLLQSRPLKKVDLFVLTGDRGLCGAFNTNILKAADRWLKEHAEKGVDVRLTLIGRKAGDHYRRRAAFPILKALTDVFRDIRYTQARELAEEVENRFVSGETDGVFLAFNEFRSVIAQKPVIYPLLPLTELAEETGSEQGTAAIDFIYEPEAEQLLGRLLSRFVAFQLFHAFLESAAAEHAARMSSMENATRNAHEMIGRLTLQMNRIRQASITKEIIEVVSGAEALG